MKMEPGLKDDVSEIKTSVECPRCISCDRPLKDASEWVGSAQKTMCLDCYEGLIDPFPKRCHAGLLV